MRERIINWPIFLLFLFWIALFALITDTASPQSIPTTSVPTNIGGLSAIMQVHLEEHAPDTVITFTLTGRRKSASLDVGRSGFMQITMDSLVQSDAAHFTIRQGIPGLDSITVWNTWAWLFNGSKRSFQYRSENRQVNIWCVSVTKTQARLRVFATWFPFMPDSVAIIKRGAQ